jgi:protein arginine N-methyltransferase 1
MYSISMYGFMIADSARMDAYVEGLRGRSNLIPSCSTSGPVQGSSRYWLVGSARAKYMRWSLRTRLKSRGRSLKRMDTPDRIECIQKLSTEIELPEKADVIVSDIRGLLPFLGRHIPSIADARSRLLKPGRDINPATRRCLGHSHRG